ncbi:MAG TPA: UDP-N-acetylmuramoyl-L-alanyl-D-glutamate--2,6-diaminopimelate ligase [Phycisphaerae bacterium]|nr:UDP-N-acetylmuramoyl-L-alanyl-D-glutamate--2,6-diaminopimelate ligase [Phycisphaerae bacterium]
MIACPPPTSALPFDRLVVKAGLSPCWAGPANPMINAVAEDSREVRPGACFVAVRGTQADGHDYVAAAIQAGAAAVVCERPVEVPAGVACLRVPDARGAAGRLAVVLYGLDRLQKKGTFQVVGITGTNGKSTFCFLLSSILKEAGCKPAMLGTVQYDLISRTITADMTTPPAATLMGYLAEAAGAGATHAVMEVSSHALDQGRCDGLRFAVGVFSNLTGDHLDYHKTMDAYLRAKKRLFDSLEPQATAVVNAEDPSGEAMVADCRAGLLSYGIVGSNGNGSSGAGPFDVQATVREMTAAGTRFELSARYPARKGRVFSRQVDSRLVGRHNVQNCLAAAGAAVALDVDLDAIAEGLEAVSCVPGRLQAINTDGAGFAVLVDYAHTDDALANVLSALKPLTRGRLTVLFGCGGDRDRTKRPRMARVAARLADRVIITSDNPRTEDPQAIIEEILTGFAPEDRPRVTVDPDRRAAIHRAMEMAGAGDVVLLAGKGHETYQVIGPRKIDFDDAAVAVEALKAKPVG